MEIKEEQVIEMKYVLEWFSYKNKGNWTGIYDDIKTKTVAKPEEIREIKARGRTTITVLDANYPEALKQTIQPPFVVFYRGNLELLNNRKKTIAVLNENLATSYATEVVNSICEDLAGNVTFAIVFGSKKSNELIRRLIGKKAKIIAILDKGIDAIGDEDRELYESLCNDHLVLTELPENVLSKSKTTELQAVKLQTALAKSVLVGGTTRKSVTSCGVGYALQIGDEIMCIPFNVGSSYEGNSLIKMGAHLVETSKDILELIKD